jgi:hypothetical protein
MHAINMIISRKERRAGERGECRGGEERKGKVRGKIMVSPFV